MGFVRKTLGIGAIVLALTGCKEENKNHNTYVDLNNDKKQEIVSGNYGEAHWNHVDYNLTTKISNSDGSYGKSKVLLKFKNKPDQIDFTD